MGIGSEVVRRVTLGLEPFMVDATGIYFDVTVSAQLRLCNLVDSSQEQVRAANHQSGLINQDEVNASRF
jgi:hypothetical protein